MTTIKYKEKKIKLPFEIKTHSEVKVKRTNPFSGQSIDLPGLQLLFMIKQYIIIM